MTNTLDSILKRGWKAAWNLFWLGVGLFGAALLAWYVARWWPGDQFLPVRLLNYFMPWLLVALLPGLVMALLARRWGVALLLAAPTLLIGLTYAPLFLPPPQVALAGGPSLKVMSYNIWGRNKHYTEIAALIRQEQPDVALLQEVNLSAAQTLKAQLADLYPGGSLYFVYEPKAGQAILSRYPLNPLELDLKAGRAQKVRLDTPTGPIEVWNIHTNQPIPWSWPKQYQQLIALTKAIAAVNGPLIVGGDFNTTDQSDGYRLLTQHLQNAHWEAGWGFGFSFPGNQPRIKRVPIITPVIRIDHIFYNAYFFARSAGTLTESGGSDHRPVTAELSR